MPTPPSPIRTLVTGGAGFIGSHLVEQLVRLNRHVTVIDDLSTGRRSNLDDVPTDHVDVIADRVSEAMPRFEPGAFDEIYHLAASVGVRLVIEQPIETIQNNIDQTTIVLDHAAAAGTPVLIASTSEVYGKSTKTPFREDDDVVYGPTIYSRWSYACSKAIDEYLALAHHRRHGLPVVIARFFNTVGPRQVGRYGMVVPRFVERAIAHESLEVHGDGRQTRCFCDVRDVVELLPRMLAEPRCHGGVFNVGRDEAITIDELARLICRTLNREAPIVHVPYEEAFGEGFDDLRHRQPDLSRLRSCVPFAPRIDLAQTILDLADHLRGKSEPAQTSGTETETTR